MHVQSTGHQRGTVMKRDDLATLAICEESRIALLDNERRILEGIATQEPLEGILQMLVTLVEQQADDMRCAILLADSAQQRLRLVAQTAITDEYRTAIEPYLVIG